MHKGAGLGTVFRQDVKFVFGVAFVDLQQQIGEFYGAVFDNFKYIGAE